jgi:hypothetical protein
MPFGDCKVLQGLEEGMVPDITDDSAQQTRSCRQDPAPTLPGHGVGTGKLPTETGCPRSRFETWDCFPDTQFRSVLCFDCMLQVR